MKIIILLLFIFGSCANMPKNHNPNKIYKKDMIISVNGVRAVGVLVVAKAKTYKFDITLRGNADMFTMGTCHRHYEIENASEKGWFKDKKKVVIEYTPNEGMEVNEACPVVLSGYELHKERHSYGWVDFQSDERTLPAIVKCNGEKKHSPGVSACQSKVGLIQEIVFPDKVIGVAQKECKKLITKDNKTFRFYIETGVCVYGFEEINGSRKHRLTALGYQDIMLRGK